MFTPWLIYFKTMASIHFIAITSSSLYCLLISEKKLTPGVVTVCNRELHMFKNSLDIYPEPCPSNLHVCGKGTVCRKEAGQSEDPA